MDFPIGSEYAPVAERISLFYKAYPTGRIITELISRTDRDVVFKATVYRSTEGEPAATGWAAEREGDSEINVVACLENTETSAIGRALANLGFTASRQRPSAEEMTKASRARVRAQRESFGVSRAESEGARQAVIPTLVAKRAGPGSKPAAEPNSVDESEHEAPLSHAQLDVLALLEAAKRAGASAARVSSLDDRVRGGVSLRSIERLEGALRRWMSTQ